MCLGGRTYGELRVSGGYVFTALWDFGRVIKTAVLLW